MKHTLLVGNRINIVTVTVVFARKKTAAAQTKNTNKQLYCCKYEQVNIHPERTALTRVSKIQTVPFFYHLGAPKYNFSHYRVKSTSKIKLYDKTFCMVSGDSCAPSAVLIH